MSCDIETQAVSCGWLTKQPRANIFSLSSPHVGDLSEKDWLSQEISSVLKLFKWIFSEVRNIDSMHVFNLWGSKTFEEKDEIMTNSVFSGHGNSTWVFIFSGEMKIGCQRKANMWMLTLASLMCVIDVGIEIFVYLLISKICILSKHTSIRDLNRLWYIQQIK